MFQFIRISWILHILAEQETEQVNQSEHLVECSLQDFLNPVAFLAKPGGHVQKDRIALVPFHSDVFCDHASRIPSRRSHEVGAISRPGCHGCRCFHCLRKHCGAGSSIHETSPAGSRVEISRVGEMHRRFQSTQLELREAGPGILKMAS